MIRKKKSLIEIVLFCLSISLYQRKKFIYLNRNLDLLSRAFFWENEAVTRLCLTREKGVAGNDSFSWRIFHMSLKVNYRDSTDFRNVAAPLMQEEHKTRSQEFKNSSKSFGTLEEFEEIETLELVVY